MEQKMSTTIQIETPNISPVDALWALFQSQSSKVRKEFAKKLRSFEKAEQEAKKMKAYESTLSQKQRDAADSIAKSIKVALGELGSPEVGLGRDIEELFSEEEG